MLNITDYLRNANQNYSDLPAHTGQSGHNYVDPFGFILFGNFFNFRKLSAIISPNIFATLSSLFSFWEPYNGNINMIDFVSELS